MSTLGINHLIYSLIAVLIAGVPLYIYGVRQGKRYATRRVTLEFQKVIHEILHLAAEHKYKELHLFLHDLVDVPPPKEEEKEPTA